MILFALLALGCDLGGCSSPQKAVEVPIETTSIAPHTVACDGASAGPDVVIVSIDTLRADRLGYAGYSKARTPNLDALAKSGTNFTQATTPVPRTTPALASMMTWDV